MITSPKGDGVIFIGTFCKSQIDHTTQEIYQLNFKSDSTFEWISMKQRLKFPRWGPIIVYIDESEVNCYLNTTTENPDLSTVLSSTTVAATTMTTTVTISPTLTTDFPGTTTDPRKGIIQGDPNQNLKCLLAITLKLCISDPMLVKPKCV